MYLAKLLVLYVSFALLAFNAPAQTRLQYPELVDRFYQEKGSVTVWQYREGIPNVYAIVFRQLLDSAQYLGLDKSDYHYEALFANAAIKNERLFTDALFAYYRDIHSGSNAASIFSYNAFATQGRADEDSLLLNSLLAINNPLDLLMLSDRLQPGHLFYQSLKAELKKQIELADDDKVKQLQRALDMQRWIFHFAHGQRIIVNIASATLRYYEGTEAQLSMKTVVGKPSTKTPRFAAWCHQVIFYPYWHVPYSIAVNEILPKCKRNPSVLDAMNMQVLNAKGVVVNPASINWSSLSKTNFPYRFRQSTGCDNSLGVIKFNLTSPYSVYMHDTNNKNVFGHDKRYYSHGCIRLEKPFELAEYLLPGVVDSNFLNACVLGQKPVTHDLAAQVPVFVIYNAADWDLNDSMQYYADVYRLGN